MSGLIALRIGLPDGKHIREATFDLLESAGILIPEYSCFSKSRSYSAVFYLPSGKKCIAFIDKPQDLFYSILGGKCDLIISGDDYMQDLLLSGFNRKASFFSANCFSAHKRLDHLGFFGTRLAFMLKETAPYNSLDEIISAKKMLHCFTEFPFIASKAIANLDSYKNRFGTAAPKIISTFGETGKNEKVFIIYSHGATESKAVSFANSVVFDLVRTGRTVEENGIKILSFFGEPVFNKIYSGDQGKQSQAAAEFVNLLEEAVISSPKKYTISYRD